MLILLNLCSSSKHVSNLCPYNGVRQMEGMQENNVIPLRKWPWSGWFWRSFKTYSKQIFVLFHRICTLWLKILETAQCWKAALWREQQQQLGWNLELPIKWRTEWRSKQEDLGSRLSQKQRATFMSPANRIQLLFGDDQLLPKGLPSLFTALAQRQLPLLRKVTKCFWNDEWMKKANNIKKYYWNVAFLKKSSFQSREAHYFAM